MRWSAFALIECLGCEEAEPEPAQPELPVIEHVEQVEQVEQEVEQEVEQRALEPAEIEPQPDTWEPAMTPPQPPSTTLAVGEQFSCALRGGDVYCWGDNAEGQLGVEGDEHRTRPVKVPGVSDVLSLVAARHHAGVLHSDGTVTCWGSDGFGRSSGVPAEVGRKGPTRVANVSDAVQLALGEYHSCVLKRDGSVWCWGRNRHGELGDGNMIVDDYEASAAVKVRGLGAASFIAAFGSLTAAVVDGAVYYWGAGAYRIANTGGSGSLPIPPVRPDELPPRRIEGLSDVAQLVLHRHHGYALTRDGRLFGFGAAPVVVGLGNPERRRTQPGTWDAFEIVGLSNVTQIATGAGHGVVRLDDGTVRAWGADPSMTGAGIRGDGTHGYQLEPSTLRIEATEIAAGADHIIVRAGDRISAWGNGWAGQLGNATRDSTAVPVRVSF